MKPGNPSTTTHCQPISVVAFKIDPSSVTTNLSLQATITTRDSSYTTLNGGIMDIVDICLRLRYKESKSARDDIWGLQSLLHEQLDSFNARMTVTLNGNKLLGLSYALFLDHLKMSDQHLQTGRTTARANRGSLSSRQSPTFCCVEFLCTGK